MLGSTHQRIAKRIAENQKLGEREARILSRGSIYPDDWQDFPHHKGKEKEILKNIIKARILFLDNNDECFHNLGVAFHYIEDSWTSSPRLRDKHTPWEIKVDSQPFLNVSEFISEIQKILLPTKAEAAYVTLYQAICKGISGVPTSVSVFPNLNGKGIVKDILSFSLVTRPSEFSDPLIDLNFAYVICNEIAKIVLTQKSPEIDAEIENWKNLLEKKAVPFNAADYLLEGHSGTNTLRVMGVESSVDSWFSNCVNAKLFDKFNYYDMNPRVSVKESKIDGSRLEISTYIIKESPTCNIKISLLPLIIELNTPIEAEYLKAVLATKVDEEPYSILRIQVPINLDEITMMLTRYKQAKEEQEKINEEQTKLANELNEFEEKSKLFWFSEEYLRELLSKLDPSISHMRIAQLLRERNNR